MTLSRSTGRILLLSVCQDSSLVD